MHSILFEQILTTVDRSLITVFDVELMTVTAVAVGCQYNITGSQQLKCKRCTVISVFRKEGAAD